MKFPRRENLNLLPTRNHNRWSVNDPFTNPLKTAIATIVICLLGLIGNAAPAQAGLLKYLKNYRLGVDYTFRTGNFASIDYETTAPTPEELAECHSYGDQSRYYCYAYVTGKPEEATYVGPVNMNDISFFLEQPFKRQGFFYLGFDVGISFHTFEGAATLENTSQSISQSEPLYKPMIIHAYGGTITPTIKVGITPKYFLDIFVSVSSGLNTLSGNYKMGNRRENLYILQRTASFGLEVVYVRFRDGYVSSFFEAEGSGTATWNFSRSINDHWIKAIRYSDVSFGLLKIVFPF